MRIRDAIIDAIVLYGAIKVIKFYGDYREIKGIAKATPVIVIRVNEKEKKNEG